MIDVPHESDNRRARLEFLFFLNDRRRRRDHLLFHLVNAGAFFPPLFFQKEPVVLRNLRSDIGLDCLVDISETVSGCGVACREAWDFSGWLLSGFAGAVGSAGAAGPFFGTLAFGATSA